MNENFPDRRGEREGSEWVPALAHDPSPNLVTVKCREVFDRGTRLDYSFSNHLIPTPPEARREELRSTFCSDFRGWGKEWLEFYKCGSSKRHNFVVSSGGGRG